MADTEGKRSIVALCPIGERNPVSASSRVKRRLGVVLTATLLAIGVPFVAHVGTAEAAEVAAAGFVTSAKVDRPQATVGQSVAVTASVKSNTTRRALIDVEIYDRSGRKVFQRYWDNQSFTAGQTRQLSTAWATSGLAAGPYTVKVGVFGVGWTPFIHWNDQAAAVTLTTTRTHHDDHAPHRRPPPHHHDHAHHHDHHDHHHDHDRPPRPHHDHHDDCRRRPAGSRRCRSVPPCRPVPSAPPVCARRLRSAPRTPPPTTTAAAAPTPTPAPTGRASTGSTATSPAPPTRSSSGPPASGASTRTSFAPRSSRSRTGTSRPSATTASRSVSARCATTAHQSAFQYSVNARTSSAYNLDYTYASWRACYEGVYTWLNTVEHNGTYAAGDVWGCIGVWFSGRWYINNDAYLNQTGDSVRWHYNNKTWLTSTFING